MKVTTFATALLLASASASAAASAEQRIATFDLGSLDTLDALGVSEHVVGVPKASLPSYLEQYDADTYTDIGGLRSPDMAALADANPTLIVHTGRQAEWAEALGEIAPLFDASVPGEAYLAAVERNVRELASQLDVESEAEEALTTLNSEIEHQREALQDAPTTLVVTHNGGNLMLNQHPVVHQVLGITALEMPESVTPEVRGERTFTPLSADAIAEINPEIVLVIDRSAAIGDEPADADQLRATLADAGAESQLVLLTPALWYLSGSGLQSLALQIDEVVSALAN
ncbi:MAG: ABC transporter substrate-binding protein [Halomonas sp.]|mgnify:FL=1|jgi:iron complex transport system substrate-binding protein|nr:ABC transporter substrate-binding protein [Halomonas sp.]NQY76669.1 ABC transporter substrate-binding protein [Halomonas sp.]